MARKIEELLLEMSDKICGGLSNQSYRTAKIIAGVDPTSVFKKNSVKRNLKRFYGDVGSKRFERFYTTVEESGNVMLGSLYLDIAMAYGKLQDKQGRIAFDFLLDKRHIDSAKHDRYTALYNKIESEKETVIEKVLIHAEAKLRKGGYERYEYGGLNILSDP